MEMLSSNPKKTDRELYDSAIRSALRVEFNTTIEEIKLYASALFEAAKWGIKGNK